MVDLDELEYLCNAAEELIRDARRWREHEELMMRATRIEETT